MKKTYRYLLALTFMFTFLAVSAFAETVGIDFSIKEAKLSDSSYDSTGVYKLVATIDDPNPYDKENTVGGFRLLETQLTFDKSVIIPVSAETGNEAKIDAGASTPVLNAIYTYYDDVNEKYVTATIQNPDPVRWTAVPDTTKYELYHAQFTTDFFPTAGVECFAMYFRFADGKTISDITDDVLSIDHIYYVNAVDNFYAKDDPSSTNMVLTNSAIQKAATITVPANSRVYFQEGSGVSPMLVKTETAVEVPRVAGYIVVNTGYTSQVQYKVAADGSYEQVALLNDALLGSEQTGLRTTDPTGIRFYSSISDVAKRATTEADNYEIYEYGYIVTAENTKTGLTAGYTLDLELVEAGKAKMGVSYDKAAGKDIIFDLDSADGRTIFTGVLNNVPMTKEALTTNIAARTYYKAKDADGKEYVVYGQITRSTLFDVAKAVRAAGGADYESNKEYVDTIISTVGENAGVDGPNIDLSELFSE